MTRKPFNPQPRGREDLHFLEQLGLPDVQALIVPIDSIVLGDNPRTELTDIDELCNSIKEHGILQPIVLSKTNSGFELISGRRRLEATKRLGMK